MHDSVTFVCLLVFVQDRHAHLRFLRYVREFRLTSSADVISKDKLELQCLCMQVDPCNKNWNIIQIFVKLRCCSDVMF